MPRHPPFSLPFLVLVFSLFISTSNLVNAIPISNLDGPSPEDIHAGAVSVQLLEGAGVNLPLRSVSFVRRRTEVSPDGYDRRLAKALIVIIFIPPVYYPIPP